MLTNKDSRFKLHPPRDERLFVAVIDRCKCTITFSGRSTGKREDWKFAFPGGAEIRCPHGNLLALDARDPSQEW